ncbi:MAG: hypothetical protein A2X12_01565 [Bacteroidetes bacterium GWE2_29_8]|nr:MAG: hypothetical protein A2X12_01565 [Bacteroidetes bacterium GWE2_29_8]OFY19952.1 MAG: hypothetical protein A2X02_05390 [Bacteroidetes bacterium GWF2_29_10]
MKKIFLLCALAVLYSFSGAQNVITGVITNQNNEPLDKATMFIPELNIGCISDQNGYYILNNVPKGKVKIKFSHLGYSNLIESLILKGGGVELNVMLKESVIETEEIVVSGGYNSTQHENAVKIDVLKINKKNMITPNFSEALTKVSGVDMISKGNGVSKPVIRGLSMNDILILNNGVRFENYQYSSHHPLGIDEFGIEDVEIIKGPASLLYGSDAIGGVINFIKERPASVGKFEGDYNLQLFSNSLGMVNNLGLKASTEKLYGGIRIGHKTNADYLEGGGDVVKNSRFNEYSIKANTGYRGKKGLFKLFYDYNNQNLGLVEEDAIESIQTRGRTNSIFYERLKTHLLSSQNKVYLGKFKMDFNAAYQNTELVHFGEEDVYEIQMQLGTLTYETRLYLPSDINSEYIIGFQGFNQTNENINNRETRLLPDATTNNYSGFGMFQHTFHKKLKLQAGGRYDNKTISAENLNVVIQNSDLNKNYGSVSGSIGATYNFSETVLLRANFASAFRTPNLAELTSNGPHEAIYELGNNTLAPEKSYEWDISTHLHKQYFTFDIAGFYNIVNDYIFLSPTGYETSQGLNIYRYIQQNSELYGGEAGIHFHPQQLKWLHCETKYSTVIGVQNNGDYLPFIPADKVSFELRAEKQKLIFFNNAYASFIINHAFKQNKPSPEETATNDYTLLNATLGASIATKNNNILICIGINNLTDEKYIDHLSTLKEVNLHNPGRNFILSVTVPFGNK